MLRNLLALPVAGSLLFGAVEAQAGWHAVQKHTQPGKETSQTSDMYYDDHRLRIDSPDTSMVINLQTGALTVIDAERKQYAEITLEELLGLRDKTIAQMRSQLDALPPEIKAQIEKQIEAQEKASKEDLKLTKTGKSETVAGHGCDVYTWSTAEGDGEACIAKKLPVDMKDFQKDALALRSRLQAKGSGTQAASLAILQLASHGFPVRTRQSMQMGQQKVVSETELVKIQSMKVPADKLKAPAGYQKRDFEQMMSEAVMGGGGEATPRPGSAPQAPKKGK